MNRVYLLVALVLLLPRPFGPRVDGPAGTAQTEPGQAKGKGKAMKKPPAEDKQLNKLIDKLATTERDKFLDGLARVAGDGETLARPEAGDAEFHGWFDRLSGGGRTWREEDITRKPIRALFKRVASRLGLTGGEIRRDEFLRYARENLSPGRSPPWGKKPPKPPADAAAKLFRKLDRDGDGVLSAGEMPAALRQELRRWDGNGDGQIDGQEYARYFEARLRRVAEDRGVRLPGPPPREEPPDRPRVYRPGKMPAGLPAWFSELDTDGDGQVGLYEWKAAGRSVDEFLRFDLNRDGLITAEEWLRCSRAAASRAARAKR